MSEPSKVIVLDPDPRAGRLVQLGLEREGIGSVLADPAGASLEIPPEAGAVLVGGTNGAAVDLVRRARQALDTAKIDIPIISAGRGASRAELQTAGANEVLSRPTFLRDVVTVCRILHGVPAQKRDRLVGSLADTSGVYALVRALGSLGRSAVLTLIRGLRRGEVRFYKGEVTSAEVGVIHGQAALHQLLLWTDAKFDFSHEDIVRRAQIPLSPEELFADAERFLEGVRDAAGTLSPATVLEQDIQRIHDLGKHIPTEVYGVLRMFDGHRVLADILEDSPYRVFETLRVAQKAVEVGLLRRVESQRRKSTWRAVLAIDEWLVGNETRDAVVERTADIDSGPTTKAHKKKKRTKRTSPPPPVSTKAEIDWGALVPRVIGAEVGPLSGVVPSLAAHGEVELPATRDRAREKLEALMDTGKRDRIFPTEVGMEPKVVIAGLEPDAMTAERSEPAEPETVRPGPKRKKKTEKQARMNAERIAAEMAKIEAERVANEKARLEEQRLEAERGASERAEAERIAKERIAAEMAKIEAERVANEKARLEEQRLEAERATRQRADAERAEAQRAASQGSDAERAEAERIAKERIAKERIAAEMAKIEAERVANEKARLEQRLDAERGANEQPRLEEHRTEAERLANEQPRLEEHRTEAERLAKEHARLEKQRLEAERTEAARGAIERARADGHADDKRIAHDSLAGDTLRGTAGGAGNAREAAVNLAGDTLRGTASGAGNAREAAANLAGDTIRDIGGGAAYRDTPPSAQAQDSSRAAPNAADLAGDTLRGVAPINEAARDHASASSNSAERARDSAPSTNVAGDDAAASTDAADDARAYAARVKAAADARRAATERGDASVVDAAHATQRGSSSDARDLVRSLVADAVPSAQPTPTPAPTPTHALATSAADAGLVAQPSSTSAAAAGLTITPSATQAAAMRAELDAVASSLIATPISGATTQPVRGDDALTKPFIRAEAHETPPITVSDGMSVAVSDVMTVHGSADTAVVTASPRVLVSERPVAQDDATPIATDDEPSDGVIRSAIGTADTARVAARARSMRPTEPEFDGPEVKEATGEIGDHRVRTGVQERLRSEPSISVEPSLLVDLGAAQNAVSAAMAKPMPAPTADMASTSRDIELAAVRQDAVSLSAEEEAFFNRAESGTGHVPKFESFDDLDEGYEPPKFWDRVLGRNKKKPL